MALSAFNRSCLARQGFGDMDDTDLARLELPLRFTPALCLALTVVATATRTAWLLGLLALMAVGAAVGLRHPFDLAWEHAVRPLVRGPHLPPNPRPRRFAFVLATPVLAGASVAFAAGANPLGTSLGALQALGCTIYVATGWCPGSFAHDKLLGPLVPVRR